jgi:xanthine dehydrogenase YagR molybdenum-binding subunit
MAREFQHLSKSTPRIDALERVTGQARYAEDVTLPGMLYARVLRSPHPHARVKSIDTSAAEALPGVRAIIHSGNTKNTWSGGDMQGRRKVFSEVVRFVGEPVACVAAVDRHIAEDALQLIRVEYEQLPAAFSIDDAMKPDATPIHPGGNLEQKPMGYEIGDVEEGLKQADVRSEQTFRTKHVNNAQLERRVSLANWDGGRVTIWASTQGIYNCQKDMATDLGLPLSKVRIICEYMGGGFGNKNQAYDFDMMAALLSKQTRRPVRVEFNRHEDFIAVHGRWPTLQHYRIGAKKDGTITAMHLKGYSGMGAYLRSSGDLASVEIYNAANVKKEVYRVYTNVSCSANYRAPAFPQAFFALESALDEIAAEIGMDPLEFRLKNLPTTWGEKKQQFSSIALEECIRQGAAAFGWAEKRRQYANQTGDIRHGIGMGLGHFGSGLGPSSATVKIFQDGSVKVFVGVTDVGTGAKTTMGLIAAEALEIPFESVSVVSGDTDVCPYSPGESGSRTTGYTGVAVIQACEKAKQELLDQAAAQLKMKREDLAFSNGAVVAKGEPGKSWKLTEIIGKNVDAIIGEVANTRPAMGNVARVCFAAHFAEVEVNLATGKIRVTRYVAAHDSGIVINKLTGGSQIKGGVVQGMGMALREELIWDRRTGVPVNNYYHGVKPMLHPEVPDIEVLFVEKEDPYGPFGSKALGEVPIVPVVGAIANAVTHATGVRVRELPITPDKILMGLRKA